MVAPKLTILDSKKGMFEYEDGCSTGYEVNELNKKAMGGTELMMHGLYSRVDKDLLDHFQIIPSRVRKLDGTKKRILWCHDLADDGEVQFLKDGGWSHFDKLVFVSHWQQQDYQTKLGVPPSMCHVLQNAITPIADHEKPDVNEQLNLVYFSTPHRGLDILYPVFDHMKQEYWQDDNVKLHVYSSFDLYGWKERDEQFQPLFDQLEEHPDIEYHGAVSNDKIHEALKDMHVFAYPSTWPETSCICLMEAMSAGLVCVHSAFAGLPETAANWTMMYPYHEDKNAHANIFAQNLFNSVRMLKEGSLEQRLGMQKVYANSFYTWETRAMQWDMFLNTFLQEDNNESGGVGS